MTPPSPGERPDPAEGATGAGEAGKGLCFHIIHGSFVDGYGIRTTVFLKGCPLRCLWCCNPEGQSPYPELKYTAAVCTGCGNCVDVCPEKAISQDAPGEKVTIDRVACTDCGRCIDVCYAGALEYFGEYYTVEQLYAVVRKDEKYYRSSGGGVTIGGGEATLQTAFTYAFMKRCQADGIHVAVDTCGYVTTEEQFRILAEADLVLFDVKGLDAVAHLAHTGVPSEVVRSTLERLSAMGKPIIIRVPVVPGFTVTRDTAEDLAAFLARFRSIQRVDLLPYHAYGEVKYGQLGREYDLPVDEDSHALAESVREACSKYGLNVQVGG